MSDAVEEPDPGLALRAAAQATGLRLGDPRLIRQGQRCDVWRCAVGGAGDPEGVIVKMSRGEGTLWRDELCGYRFLEANHLAGHRTPRLFGADEERRLIVLADLGEVPTLGTLLRGRDVDAAERALVSTARALGDLHGRARGADVSAVERLRAEPRCVEQAREFRDLTPRILDLLRRVEVTPAAGLEADLDAVAQRFSSPGPWLTFTLGDLAPSNVLLAPEGPIFIDLEYCGRRHALYDAMIWHSFCPFPDSIVPRMAAAYRDGLGPWCERDYDVQVAFLAAHRTAWSLTWNVFVLLEKDVPWVPDATGRELLLAWLLTFERAAPASHGLAALSASMRALRTRLQERWPESQPAAFPVFSVP